MPAPPILPQKSFIITTPEGKKYKVTGPTKEGALAALKSQLAKQAETKDFFGVSHGPAAESGSVLPFSRDTQGRTFLDPNAGLLGSIISGFKAPGDVAMGKLDPQSPEGERRAMEAAGLMISGNPMVNSGDRAIAGTGKNLVKAAPEVPTAEMLSKAGGAGYQAARDMGVDYAPEAVASLAKEIETALQTKGLRDVHAPEVFSLLRSVETPPVVEGGNTIASLPDLLALRDALQASAGNVLNKRESMAASVAIKELDKFLEGHSPESVVAGPAAAAAATLKEANANLAAGHRSDAISTILRKAERRAGTANSGLNVDNAIRQRLASFLEKPKQTRGFSEEELALLEKITAGTKTANAARTIGNLMGGGGGLGAAVSGGGAGAIAGLLGGPITGAAVGAGVPLTGIALRKLAASLTKREVELLGEIIRKRSPLYEKSVANPPMVPASPEPGLLLLRMLGLTGTAQQEAQ